MNNQQENIEKIEAQLSTDLEQRNLLKQRVAVACQNMQNLLNQSKEISSQYLLELKYLQSKNIRLR